MKWDDDLLLEADPEGLALRGQWQLAMYALHLSSGHSIYCRRIRAATIEQYVLAAATFHAAFTGLDYRKDRPTDTHLGHILAPVFKDLKSYESIPDRREPYDFSMHAEARKISASSDRDGLSQALTDGFEQGLCAGYRLSEWAQPGGLFRPAKPQADIFGATRAIVPMDVRCRTMDQRTAVGLAILRFPLPSINRLWVKFRTQKNGQHGEEKLFMRNPSPDGICLVRAVYSALGRFQRLSRIDPALSSTRTPLSVYRDTDTQSVCLITSRDIETFMRSLAATVYHLDPHADEKDLQRWGSHSLRVGACVALHAMGFSPLDIQWLLRWRSMAFTAYLRNVAALARRQYQALDKAAAMPHFV